MKPPHDDPIAGHAFVRLRPPLPVVDELLGGGFVQALAAEAMQVQFADGADVGVCHGRLQLVFAGERIYSFDWTASASDSRSASVRVLHIQDAQQRANLADLLTLVRKSQHIAICASSDVEASDRYTGFSDLVLRPKALPECSWQELDTSVAWLGRTFTLPLLVTGMTGGLTQGALINERLARAAAQLGIPMGVGSQRVALDEPQHAAIFAVKKIVPQVFLIGNIGIAQLLRGDPLAICQRAAAMIDADALAIHVNVLQEVIQVEGDRDFRGVLAAISKVARGLERPLIVKEVGAGLDAATARHLLEAGVAAIDCGGKGGTSWSYIEGERATSAVTRSVAATFRDWGIPTAVAVDALRQAAPQLPLVATGGIRDGLEVAKAVALGATLCGIGLPLLRAALNSDEAVASVLATLVQGLKTAMICSGARSLAELPARLYRTPAFREQLARYGVPVAGAHTP